MGDTRDMTYRLYEIKPGEYVVTPVSHMGVQSDLDKAILAAQSRLAWSNTPYHTVIIMTEHGAFVRSFSRD